MRIVETYSHLNGLEFILVRHPGVWEELQAVIGDVDAESCRTRESMEQRKQGQVLYSPVQMNKEFKGGSRRGVGESPAPPIGLPRINN